MTNESSGRERLAPYYQAAREEAARYQEFEPVEQLVEQIHNQTEAHVGLVETIATRLGVGVIAEHKRQSPSEGEIRPGSSVQWTVEQYQRGGAMAVSVLTQGAHFGGRIEDLTEAHAATSLPLLRKDFIDRPYQLYQAKARGAAAALLIVAGLEDVQLQDLQDEARDIGLDCLVEVHDEQELYRALEISPSLIGINNRDLRTLKTDIATTRGLVELVPKGIPVVAESGYDVNNAEHIRELRQLKVDAVLMGTSLMREAEPAEALAKWLATDQAG